jgi:hypothetical protein
MRLRDWITDEGKQQSTSSRRVCVLDQLSRLSTRTIQSTIRNKPCQAEICPISLGSRRSVTPTEMSPGHATDRRERNPADVIRPHRDEHARDWVMGACQEAIATGYIAAVIQRFIQEPLYAWPHLQHVLGPAVVDFQARRLLGYRQEAANIHSFGCSSNDFRQCPVPKSLGTQTDVVGRKWRPELTCRAVFLWHQLSICWDRHSGGQSAMPPRALCGPGGLCRRRA